MWLPEISMQLGISGINKNNDIRASHSNGMLKNIKHSVDLAWNTIYLILENSKLIYQNDIKYFYKFSF